MKILIFILIMGGFIGGLVGIVLHFMKKMGAADTDNTESDNITSAQEFLPFSDIRDNMIILPGQKYRAVLECTSMNYQLKTASEREQIELAFQRFLNSVNFPITFFLQTKTIDNSNRLKILGEEIAQTLQDFPDMQDYANQYYRDMETLNTRIGNAHQKKRYIIVTYDDVSELDNLSKDEQFLYAQAELRNRCGALSSNLEGAGVRSHMLNTEELIELVYSCYYRDDYSYAECIANGDAYKLFVDGEKDHFKELTKDDLMQFLCQETIDKIKSENLDTIDSGKALLAALTNISNNKGGSLK